MSVTTPTNGKAETKAKAEKKTRERDPRLAAREAVTQQIRDARKLLQWSAEDWKAFTCEDMIGRADQLQAAARQLKATAAKFQTK